MRFHVGYLLVVCALSGACLDRAPGYDDRGNSGAHEAGSPSVQWRQVATGYEHNFALDSDGAISCWGADWWQQATPPSGSCDAKPGSVKTAMVTAPPRSK